MALTPEDALARDAADPLAGLRSEFVLPPEVIYLDGNSLGPPTHRGIARVRQVVEREWAADLIKSWNLHGWIDLPMRVGGRLAGMLGAATDEIVATDSTTVNLFRAVLAALALRPDRRVVVVEADNFPADNYVVQGIRERFRPDLILRPVAAEHLGEAITDDVAVVVCSHVNYRSGLLQDLAGLTARARAAGAIVVWDLAHSAGVVPIDLAGADADFAVGCGYKYLCGGPGAPAFLFVRRALQDRIDPVLTGWLGHAAPFSFEATYRPAPGIRRQLCGTPAVIAMASLDAALEVLAPLDSKLVRDKSVRLTTAFVDAVEDRCAGLGLTVASPPEPERRGSQIALRHPDGHAIVQALASRGVIGDFRAPDVLRFGFAPHYLREADAWAAAEHLREVVAGRIHERPEFRVRAYVT